MSDNTGVSWTRARIRNTLNLVLVIAGVAYTYHSHVDACPREVILGAWLLAPPVWFFIQYTFLFDRENESLEMFKQTQGLIRNFWLGMVAFLGALYLPFN